MMIQNNVTYSHKDLTVSNNWLSTTGFVRIFVDSHNTLTYSANLIKFLKGENILLISKAGTGLGYIYIPALLKYINDLLQTDVGWVRNGSFKYDLYNNGKEIVRRLKTYQTKGKGERECTIGILNKDILGDAPAFNSNVSTVDSANTEADRERIINDIYQKNGLKVVKKQKCGLPKIAEVSMIAESPKPSTNKQYVRKKVSDGYKKLFCGIHVKKYKYIYIEK